MAKAQNNFLKEDINPCLEESSLSYQCLEKNFYDQRKCEPFFANYRACKKFWGRIMFARKRAGITPNMPCSEERAKILEKRKTDQNAIQAN